MRQRSVRVDYESLKLEFVYSIQGKPVLQSALDSNIRQTFELVTSL